MLTLALPDFSPAAIAESGQCFRMRQREDGAVELTALGRFLRIEPGEQPQTYRFSCPEEEFTALWRDYFDLGADYAQYRACCKKNDDYLRRACACGAGLRILRQDPWEMLVSFIISQRKSIPAIRTAIETLCTAYGDPFDGAGRRCFAFPTAQRLAGLTEADLAACGLGYRAKYVLDAARRAADGRLDLPALQNQPTDAVRQALLEVYGVGVKVAQCVLLFGYHRLEALPVDVWMDRVVQEVYGGKFPRSYGKYAGVLQQYLFYYVRAEHGRVKTEKPAESK